MKAVKIDLKGANKRYGDHNVLIDLNLQIAQGECFGLLGPNGAGKSTLLKILSCQIPLSSGQAYVHGLNLFTHGRQIKSRTGIVPQVDGLEDLLSVSQNLQVFSRYFGMDKKTAQARIDDVLRLVRLENVKDQIARNLSGGMRRRLALARALVNQPELLMLDEPTTGLDSGIRQWIWDFLKKKKNQTTILLTTHYMEEAEFLCDRVALMEKGRLIAVGNPQQLIQEQVGEQVVEFDVKASDRSYYLSRLRENKFSASIHRGLLCVFVRKEQESKELLNLLTSSRMTFRQPNLNDVFLRLTGHEIANEADEGVPS